MISDDGLKENTIIDFNFFSSDVSSHKTKSPHRDRIASSISVVIIDYVGMPDIEVPCYY